MKEENIIMIIKRLNKDDHEEKELSIEDMLDEADAEAKNNQVLGSGKNSQIKSSKNRQFQSTKFSQS